MTLRGSENLLQATFSPDGKHLVGVKGTPVLDPTVKLYDVRTGEEEATIKCPRGTRLFFSPDGTRLILSAWGLVGSGSVQVAEVPTGRVLLGLDQTAMSSALPQCSPDGALIAVPMASGAVRLHGLRTGEEIGVLKCRIGVRAFAFSPDGARLALVGEGEPELRVYDARGGGEVTTFRASLRLLPDHRAERHLLRRHAAHHRPHPGHDRSRRLGYELRRALP